MQISGYGSMSEYYAELARQRARLNAASASQTQAPQSTPATGSAQAASGDFASIFAEQTAAAEGAEASSQSSPTAAADMLRFLAGSAPASASAGAPVEGAASAMAGSADPARGSIFNEMLKSFGGTGSGGGFAYLQNMVRGAYGV